MMQRANAHSQLFLVGIIGIAIAFGALVGSWSFSDKSFQNGFEAALAERSLQDGPSTIANKRVPASKHAFSATAKLLKKANLNLPISGNEEFWLGQTRFTGISPRRVVLAGPFKLGDQLTIGLNDSKRVWTVVNIAELTQPASTSSPEIQKPSILLVTLRDSSSEAGAGPLMRIIVDTNDMLMGTRVSSAPSVATL